MKQKYNLDIFTVAAEMMDDTSHGYSCNAISEAAYQLEGQQNPCEKKLFQDVFGLSPDVGSGRYVFGQLAMKEGLGPIDGAEMRAIRVLALLFVREIARGKNRQGTHTARAAKRDAARKQKELEKRAAAEFAAIKNQIDSVENDLKVDLRTCKPGDKLLSKRGEILTYLKYIPQNTYPHTVQYPNGAWGSRLDNGHVWRKNRMPEDSDIVKILR